MTHFKYGECRQLSTQAFWESIHQDEPNANEAEEAWSHENQYENIPRAVTMLEENEHACLKLFCQVCDMPLASRFPVGSLWECIGHQCLKRILRTRPSTLCLESRHRQRHRLADFERFQSTRLRRLETQKRIDIERQTLCSAARDGFHGLHLQKLYFLELWRTL